MAVATVSLVWSVLPRMLSWAFCDAGPCPSEGVVMVGQLGTNSGARPVVRGTVRDGTR